MVRYGQVALLVLIVSKILEEHKSKVREEIVVSSSVTYTKDGIHS